MKHPIIPPPPNLVEKWVPEVAPETAFLCRTVSTKAVQWGADQELDACVMWLNEWSAENMSDFEYRPLGEELRSDRRRKPDLKRQALSQLQEMEKVFRDGYPCNSQDDVDWDVIRSTLESLPDTLTSRGNDDNRDN